MTSLPFRDRSDAGQCLAAELRHHKLPSNAVILALPRGGIPVGFAIAQALHLPLDVIVARKLGVPWQPELAMGAIAGQSRALDEELIRELGGSRQDVDAIVTREKAELERRENLYRGGRPPRDLHGRTIVLVDDGLATGSTMLAAARCVRSLGPESLRIAVPVGSRQGCQLVGSECDECICLAEPRPFAAVGQWYGDFRQVSDAQVTNLLEQCRRQAV